MLRIKDRRGQDMLFGPTHEEVFTVLFKNYVQSYKDLPLNLYQIQWKFRDEIRPRHGLMRCREFLMKDAYSFDIDNLGAQASYNKMFAAYFGVFARLGVQALAVKADTGPIGGDMSHEFQILCENGESTTYFDPKILELTKDPGFDPLLIRNLYAADFEMAEREKSPVELQDLKKSRAIEVGHLFNFDTKYSKLLDASITGPDGARIHPCMGSYGIGVSRLFAGLIEVSHDEKGIIWPEAIAPFKFVVIKSNTG